MTFVPSKSLDLYSPQRIGLTMKEVGSDVVEVAEQKFSARWFVSASRETEIHLWSDERNVLVKIQVLHLGSVVEWTRSLGLRTGMTLESELIDEKSDSAKILTHSSWGIGEESSQTAFSHSIIYDSKINLQNAQLAESIIRYSPCIAQDLKKEVMNHICSATGTSIQKKTNIVRRVLSFFKINL